MNNVTISGLSKQRPLEPMLEREIKIRAFELYEQRGGRPGHDLEDWLRAEAEVMLKAFGPTGGRAGSTEYIRGLPYPCV